MQCPFCDHPRPHRHGKTSKGTQRYRCSNCKQTFTETFDTLYYRRQVTAEQARSLLQAHSEGSSLRGVSRTSGWAYGTVVSIIRASTTKGQLVHNQQVQAVESEEIEADEFWSFVKKSRSSVKRKNSKLETVGLR